MSNFLQLHLLTSYPPANLNRDDLGRPKTCTIGGVERLRISSQSLKRAWRTSSLFRDMVGDPLGIRTKRMGVLMFRALVEGRPFEEEVQIEQAGDETPPAGKLKKLKPEVAFEIAKEVAAVFGKLGGEAENNDGEETEEDGAKPQKKTTKKVTKDKDADSPPISDRELELKQLTHFSHEEIAAVSKLLEKARKAGEIPPETGELRNIVLQSENSAADIAMFGRFLADKREFCVEAAVQVAHPFGVQRATITDDFFTAVDDLNRRDASGAGHMDVSEFDSGLFYLYVCVDRDLLQGNLQGKKDLANRAQKALAACAAQVAPIGKQASYASRAYASYILAEKGEYQPRSLSVGYLDPINGPGVLSNAVKILKETADRMNEAYGQEWKTAELDTLTSNGSLRELEAFVAL
jgi:CRISPR system Cascade subunit CasC